MTDNRHNVMPFQQDAGFFARRALKKQKDGRFQEAVVLLRRALEAAPDNAGYLLDLAETYSEMGCPIESNRCLMRLLTRLPHQNVCWFALACNLFSMGNVRGAQSAALEYLEREPKGEYAEQAAGMISALQQARQLHQPAGRRLNRCYQLNERAAARLNRDQPEAAARLLETSLALRDAPDSRALYAFALGEAGHKREAAREASRVLSLGRLSGEARINALRALVAAGRRRRALALIETMDARDLEPYEARRVLDALFVLGSDRSIQPRLSRALRLSPFDRALLHAQAAVFYNEGDVENALVWWRHMLEINPTDAVAAAYVAAATGDDPPAGPIPLTLTLAPALADAQRGIITAATEAADLFPACRWALLDGDAESACAAAARLAAFRDEESETLLREALMEPTVSPAVKLAAQDALRRRGAAEPWLVVGRDSLSPGPDDTRLIAPGRALKKCLGAACLMDEAVLPAFLARWSAVMPKLYGRGYGALSGLSAALLAQTAAERGDDQAAEALWCSRRRLAYYAKKLNRLTGEEQTHEVH